MTRAAGSDGGPLFGNRRDGVGYRKSANKVGFFAYQSDLLPSVRVKPRKWLRFFTAARTLAFAFKAIQPKWNRLITTATFL